MPWKCCYPLTRLHGVIQKTMMCRQYSESPKCHIKITAYSWVNIFRHYLILMLDSNRVYASLKFWHLTEDLILEIKGMHDKRGIKLIPTIYNSTSQSTNYTQYNKCNCNYIGWFFLEEMLEMFATTVQAELNATLHVCEIGLQDVLTNRSNFTLNVVFQFLYDAWLVGISFSF